MAGTPKKRETWAKITEFGGVEAICERIAAGDSMVGLAREIGVGRHMLYKVLRWDPRAKEMVAEARRLKAESHAHDALRMADEVEEAPNAISKVREQIRVRQWLAGAENPERYGQKAAAAVNVNVGDLHIEALKKVQETQGQTIDGEAESND